MNAEPDFAAISPPVLKIGAVVVRAVASHQSPVASDVAPSATAPSPLAGEGWGEGASSDANNPHAPPSNLPPQGGKASPAVTLSPDTTHHSLLATHDILIIRPIPKHVGEVPAFVLPRGSRQYQDASGAWQDARDAQTGIANAHRLEPYARALMREIDEEAGVSGDMLARARVVELGAMDFASRTKGTYPIHWFAVMPVAEDAALLDQRIPVDATAVRWASLDEIKALAATEEFSPGYVPVIEAALAMLSAPH